MNQSAVATARLGHIGDVWVHKLKMTANHPSIGEWHCVYEEHNLVVDAGKNLGASRLISNTDGVLSHIGVGSSNTAAAAGQTALVTPLGDRKPFDSAATRNNNVVSMTATFNAGEATGTIWEFGLFNALTVGTMFSRSVGAAGIPKGTSDVIAVTWQITAQ